MKKIKGIEIKGIDGLGDLLEELKEALTEKDFVRSELGTIPKELLDEMFKNEYDDEDLKEEIKRKLEDATRKLKREYEEKIKVLEKRELDWWEKVYKHVGSSDEKGDHTVDRRTGMVSLKVTSKQDAPKLFQ